LELLSFVPKILSQEEELQKKDTWILTWSILDERAANCHGTGKYKSIQPSATLISVGKAKPSLIVSHELSLNEAPDAYKHYDVKRMDENNP
jgi:threonine dehydrogenase-like Zn-dependent dehydrogenase